MKLDSLDGEEMDNTLETLLGAEDMRRQLTAARNTIADLQEALALAARNVPCTTIAPGKHLTFKNHLHTLPADVETGDAFAVTLVAVAGANNYWSCFVGQSGRLPSWIAAHGDRVPLARAGIFTHVMGLREYY